LNDVKRTLALLAQGELGPGMALARLLMELGDVTTVQVELLAAAHAVPDSRTGRAARELLALLDAHRAGALEVVRLARSALDDATPAASLEAGLERSRRLFDWGAAIAPETSMAVYALGSLELLAAATAELMELLERCGVLAPERRVLDLGCGTGRVAAALAARVGSITACDISGAMVARARDRCRGLGNVTVQQIDGRDLGPFAARSFDLVLAVDSFPYVYRAGGDALARRYLEDSARLLRPGGDILILNLSYRGDLEADRGDLQRFARSNGFNVLRDGARELGTWDAPIFHLRRHAAPGRPDEAGAEA
jgi:SAM-dependent methyltransferase